MNAPLIGKRFIVALAAIVTNITIAILAHYKIAISTDIQNELIELVTALAVAYIGGQSITDIKLGGGSSALKLTNLKSRARVMK